MSIGLWWFCKQVEKAGSIDQLIDLAAKIKICNGWEQKMTALAKRIKNLAASVNDVVIVNNHGFDFTTRPIFLRVYAEQEGSVCSLEEGAALMGALECGGEDGQKAKEAIMAATKPHMKVPEGSTLEQLDEMAKLVHGGFPEADRLAFEQSAINAVLANRPTPQQVADFAKKSMQTVSGYDGLLVAYVTSNDISHTLKGLAIIRDGIRNDLMGLFHGKSNKKVKVALAAAIRPIFVEHISHAADLTLDQLRDLAMLDSAYVGEEEGLRALENHITNNIFPENGQHKINTAKEAADFAKNFCTPTGRHRFIIFYCEGLVVSTPEDVDVLREAIKGNLHYGGRAKLALLEAARKEGVKIDVDTFLADSNEASATEIKLHRRLHYSRDTG